MYNKYFSFRLITNVLNTDTIHIHIYNKLFTWIVVNAYLNLVLFSLARVYICTRVPNYTIFGHIHIKPYSCSQLYVGVFVCDIFKYFGIYLYRILFRFSSLTLFFAPYFIHFVLHTYNILIYAMVPLYTCLSVCYFVATQLPDQLSRLSIILWYLLTRWIRLRRRTRLLYIINISTACCDGKCVLSPLKLLRVLLSLCSVTTI